MGAIKYYPSTRIRTNLYTRGREFKLPDGSFYSGRYYLTYDGKAYTGIDPVVGANEPLVPAQQDNRAVSPVVPAQRDNRVVSSISTRSTVNNTQIPEPNSPVETGELRQLVPYYPIPLDSDYARGYFTRYFAKQLVGQNFILEISETDWANINNGLTQQDFVAYEVTSMLWQLTGPRNNKRISQYQIQGGVFDTNKRVTEGKNRTFTGLLEYIGGDYTKFARITP